MGCNYRPLGVAMGALMLASCAGSGLETADAPQADPAAEQESAAADAVVMTGGRVKVGNMEASGHLSVMAPPPPPPPAPAMRQAPGSISSPRS